MGGLSRRIPPHAALPRATQPRFGAVSSSSTRSGEEVSSLPQPLSINGELPGGGLHGRQGQPSSAAMSPARPKITCRAAASMPARKSCATILGPHRSSMRLPPCRWPSPAARGRCRPAGPARKRMASTIPSILTTRASGCTAWPACAMVADMGDLAQQRQQRAHAFEDLGLATHHDGQAGRLGAGVPPETRQSSASMPRSASCTAISRVTIGEMVLWSTQMVPADAPSTTPCAPSSTARVLGRGHVGEDDGGAPGGLGRCEERLGAKCAGRFGGLGTAHEGAHGCGRRRAGGAPWACPWRRGR